MDTINDMSMALSSAVPSTSAKAVTVPMRAIVHRRYGTPEVLAFEEVERPVPGDDEVLVRVHAAGANVGDHHVVTGKPYVVRLSPHGSTSASTNAPCQRNPLWQFAIASRRAPDRRRL